MYRKAFLKTALGVAVGLANVLSSASAFAQAQYDGSAAKPLRVILVPADGGTEDGTKKNGTYFGLSA